MDPRDNRGPWEYLWHEILRGTTDDRYSQFVYGGYCTRMSFRRFRTPTHRIFSRNINHNHRRLLARRGLLHAT